MDGITIDEFRSVFGNNIEQINENTKNTYNSLKEFKKLFRDILGSLNENKQLLAATTGKKTEVEFSRDDKKSVNSILTTLKSNTDAIKEQIKFEKDSQQKNKSLLSKILGPIAVVLTTVAALGFGLTKFPALRGMLTNVGGGNLMGSIFNLSKVLGNKEATFKQWLKNIPIVGFFVHVYDAFSYFAKGQYEKGIRELAFNFPGIDFIAPIFGTSRSRLNVLAYNKSQRQGVNKKGPFGIDFESGIDSLIGGIDEKLNNVFTFFSNAGELVRNLFSSVTKGDYKSISNSLTSLSKLFPSLTGASEFIKGVVLKQFSATANRTPGKTFEQINFIDVAKNLYERVSTSVGDLFKSILTPIQNIFKSLSMVFSGNLSKQKAGLAILGIYFPSLTEGFKVILSLTDKMQEIKAKSKDGKIGIYDLVKELATGKLDAGKYDVEEDPKLFAQREAIRKEIESARERMSKRKGMESQKYEIEERLKRLNEQKERLEAEAKVSKKTLVDQRKVSSILTPQRLDSKNFEFTKVLTSIDEAQSQYNALKEDMIDFASVDSYEKFIDTNQRVLEKLDVLRAEYKLGNPLVARELAEEGVDTKNLVEKGSQGLAIQIATEVSKALGRETNKTAEETASTDSKLLKDLSETYKTQNKSLEKQDEQINQLKELHKTFILKLDEAKQAIETVNKTLDKNGNNNGTQVVNTVISPKNLRYTVAPRTDSWRPVNA